MNNITDAAMKQWQTQFHARVRAKGGQFGDNLIEQDVDGIITWFTANNIS